MRDNFEHIKKLVENFEVEYNPQAWESLSKKLDQISTPSAKPNFGKYIWTGAAVTAIAVSSVFYFNSDSSTNKKTVIAKNETSSKTELTNQPSIETLKSITSENDVIIESNTIESKTPTIHNITTDGNGSIPVVHVNEGHDKQNFENITKKSDSNFGSTQTSHLNTLKLPILKTVCVNETVSIKNENNSSLSIYYEQDKIAQIEPNKNLNFTAKTDGIYYVSGYENGNLIKEKFIVVSISKPHINSSDDIDYDSGLPILNASTEDAAQSYEWKIDGKIIGNQKTVNFPAFYKGDLNLSLEITNQNGCKSTETKKIEIEENYNLLAVNAFEPNNANPKKNSFMPYALTKREVKFNLIIIDPTSGAIIFESSDPTNPWTGVNKNTGQMMPNNKSYIWKVTLLQPAKGEKTEYKGMITLL